MAIRIGGMYSGLDTDAMVKELVSAYSTKKDSIQKQKDALEWKQESWDTLNKDIYDFYASSLSNNPCFIEVSPFSRHLCYFLCLLKCL